MAKILVEFTFDDTGNEYEKVSPEIAFEDAVHSLHGELLYRGTNGNFPRVSYQIVDQVGFYTPPIAEFE